VIWNRQNAMEVARAANDRAREAEAKSEVTLVRLEAHMAECSKNWQRLDENLTRREETARTDQLEWRVTLGHRLDRQDRIQQTVAGALILMLLSIISFFVVHSGVFH
jgi:hypothetical protein